MQALRSHAKTMGLGVALYRLFHAPKGMIHRYLKRDPIRRTLDSRAQLKMEESAYTLPPLPDFGTGTPLDIHFLTGKHFWYQTCFCAYSMAQQGQVNLRPIIYDDGTLEPDHQAEFQRIFPTVEIVSRTEIYSRLEENLPAHQFPALRQRRLTYPNLRKLTDIHIGSSGWKLVLDSDMLFFRPPTLLLEWVRSPHSPCHMVDINTAYGYSASLMATLAGTPIPERINVGICGLQSEALDWDELEFWCKTLIEQEGTHYYQEQAMIAMLMARQPCLVVPASEYIVLPDVNEVRQPQGILHHYVADSKAWYFRYGWPSVMQYAQEQL